MSAEETAGQAERLRAAQAYRGTVRLTGVAIVFALAGVFALNAVLPATAPSDRSGLLITAGLAALAGMLWFGVVPRSWFAGARVFAASTVATAVLLVMVLLTGGVQSLYLGYLVIPPIVLILQGSLPQMLVLAGLIVVSISVIAALSAAAGFPLGEGAPARLLLLASVIGTCAAIAYVTGRQRERATERAAGLADEGERAMSAALTDALTGLPNRRALDEQLARVVADATRTSIPFSAIAIDLDGLKRLNDDLGHDAGDILLRNFGRAIDQAIRGSDMGFRVGGDEFLILLPRTSEMSAKTVVDRLAEGAPDLAAFSHGIATSQPGELGGAVLVRADGALNASKRLRRSTAG